MPTDHTTDSRVESSTVNPDVTPDTSPDVVDLRSPWSRLRADLLLRGVVVVAALVCVLAGVSQAVSGTLVLLGLALATERLARLRRRGGLDTLLVTVGGAVTTLVITGIVLGATPIGLHARTWGIALPVVSALGLAAATFGGRPSRTHPSRAGTFALLRATPWVAASLVVVAVSVGISERSVTASQDVPVQMSFGPIQGTKVDVVVSSPSDLGPLELRQTSGQTDLTYPTFSVAGGTSVHTELTLPTTGRYTITLSYPDQDNPLRTLVIDR